MQQRRKKNGGKESASDRTQKGGSIVRAFQHSDQYQSLQEKNHRDNRSFTEKWGSFKGKEIRPGFPYKTLFAPQLLNHGNRCQEQKNPDGSGSEFGGAFQRMDLTESADSGDCNETDREKPEALLRENTLLTEEEKTAEGETAVGDCRQSQKPLDR